MPRKVCFDNQSFEAIEKPRCMVYLAVEPIKVVGRKLDRPKMLHTLNRT